jgi:ribosomal protein L7/L12
VRAADEVRRPVAIDVATAGAVDQVITRKLTVAGAEHVARAARQHQDRTAHTSVRACSEEVFASVVVEIAAERRKVHAIKEVRVGVGDCVERSPGAIKDVERAVLACEGVEGRNLAAAVAVGIEAARRRDPEPRPEGRRLYPQ